MYFKAFNFELHLECKTESNVLSEIHLEVGAAPDLRVNLPLRVGRPPGAALVQGPHCFSPRGFQCISSPSKAGLGFHSWAAGAPLRAGRSAAWASRAGPSARPDVA